jgi:hypothetical protein
MFGSIDCTHWPWERCPTMLKGQFTRGDQIFPTIILEVWHHMIFGYVMPFLE